MRLDTKYQIVAYAVVRELKQYTGETYAAPFVGDEVAISRLGIAIQRAVQALQLREISRDLELLLPEEWEVLNWLNVPSEALEPKETSK